MKTIYKYVIPIGSRFSISLPEGAEVLTVQTQFEKPCLWALVDTEKLLVSRTFSVFGTGWKIPDEFPGLYIGTFQLDGGSLVFHLFEDVPGEEFVLS